MTLQELLRYGESKLREADVPESKINAWYLFSHVTGMTRSDFFINGTMDADKWQSQYEEILKQRMKRKPLEYITEETEFMGIPFYVNEHVLIPRQDTECLVEQVLPLVKGKDVLDMCTGSGCIGVSLSVLGDCHSVTMSDLSKEALAVAKRNATSNQVTATFIQGDLFEAITQSYDVIVSNPPYIPSEEVMKLMPEVKDYEPLMALDGTKDGLHFYRRIVEESNKYLRLGGWLCFEIGYDQGLSVSSLMEEAGYERVSIKKDLAGMDRIVMGRRMEESYV